MESIKNYILSLAGFSFISSLACALLPQMPARRTVKFICGIILSVLVISPLTHFEANFSDIFLGEESYNLYSDSTSKIQDLNLGVISDKVSEIVGNSFESRGVYDVQTEVIFDGEGNILSVNINSYNEDAAKEAAATLGIPYEIIHMTE